jgi:hypothetical protein
MAVTCTQKKKFDEPEGGAGGGAGQVKRDGRGGWEGGGGGGGEVRRGGRRGGKGDGRGEGNRVGVRKHTLSLSHTHTHRQTLSFSLSLSLARSLHTNLLSAQRTRQHPKPTATPLHLQPTVTHPQQHSICSENSIPPQAPPTLTLVSRRAPTGVKDSLALVFFGELLLQPRTNLLAP